MRITSFPAGFILPAEPVVASKPSSGADWVHEIKHDDYRLLVHWDGPAVRLYSRNASDWTARSPAIAAAAERIGAKSFRWTAKLLSSGPTACHVSMSCVGDPLRGPQSFSLST
jgi:hypothetical protein